MATFPQELVIKVKALSLALDDEQSEKLMSFANLLFEYSKHTNLVGNACPEVVLRDHIVDSLSLVPVIAEKIEAPSTNLIDIGSGAGFPGLVLAVALPQIKVRLVESVAKKAKFLELAVEKLGLAQQVEVINERAEDLAHQDSYRHQHDFATARAVASLDVTAEFCLPLLRKGGYFLAQKSQAQRLEEEAKADLALKALGGQLDCVLELDEAVIGKRHILFVVRKVADTEKIYPRPTAKIKRAPLGGR